MRSMSPLARAETSMAKRRPSGRGTHLLGLFLAFQSCTPLGNRELLSQLLLDFLPGSRESRGELLSALLHSVNRLPVFPILDKRFVLFGRQDDRFGLATPNDIRWTP